MSVSILAQTPDGKEIASWITQDDGRHVAPHIALDRHGWLICTKERPWKPEDGVPVAHDAERDAAGLYRCQNCGHEWRLKGADETSGNP